ncbi:hypothetical protein PWT90_06665 [Aphanocladium album]|nr:hypothetical protein PWT90_06665 [Aphanocladium album]
MCNIPRVMDHVRSRHRMQFKISSALEMLSAEAAKESLRMEKSLEASFYGCEENRPRSAAQTAQTVTEHGDESGEERNEQPGIGITTEPPFPYTAQLLDRAQSLSGVQFWFAV